LINELDKSAFSNVVPSGPSLASSLAYWHLSNAVFFVYFLLHEMLFGACETRVSLIAPLHAALLTQQLPVGEICCWVKLAMCPMRWWQLTTSVKEVMFSSAIVC